MLSVRSFYFYSYCYYHYLVKMMRSRVGAPKAPEKGSFPLDHFSECTSIFKEYVKCLKDHQNDNRSCKLLSKSYIECRIENGLMAPDEMDRLGFGVDAMNSAVESKKIEEDLKLLNEKRHAEGYVGMISY